MLTNKFNYDAIPRETVDGKRHYCLPDGSKVPSVTTILDRTKPQKTKDALANWRKNVGEVRAKQITEEAANRGTRMHTYLEHYILNDDMKDLPTNPFAQPSWYMAAEVILNGLQHIDEYWGVEAQLYYSGLYAGTTDLVGVWKGKPAIMDFKQTNKPKKREWIDDYFIQLAAYAAAHNDMHGTNINTGVILMCAKPINEHAQPQYIEFEVGPEEFAVWEGEWFKRVEAYYGL